MDVIALGELLIDLTENGLSEQGNPLLEANPGGAPCNVLAMLRRLGRSAAFIGKVGADAFGDMLARTVANLGVDISGLVRDEEVHTTLACVHTAPDGERSFSFYRNPGADMMLRADEIEYDKIADAKIFHFGTLSMTDDGVRDATLRAVEFARSHGLLISFDPNLRPPLWKSLDDAREMMRLGFERCDILKISDDEIIFYTGADTIDEAVLRFRAQYSPRLMCVTLGRNGSRAYCGDISVYTDAFLMENTIETTGAGDTFMACMLDAVLEHGVDGLSAERLSSMMSFAAAASAIVTTRRGALNVMPEREEVEALLRLRA